KTPEKEQHSNLWNGIEERKKNETLEKKLEEWMKNNLAIDVEIESVHKINKEMYVRQVSKYDLTKKERDIQGWIREEANAEKEKGNKVRIGYKKLTINEKIWTWN
ncbi:unnamed protein product, partial [Tenebrio molitor]